MLLRKDYPRNRVLGAHMIVDGSMSKHVIVPASGTVKFPTPEAVANDEFYFDLVEPEAMKNQLNAVSMDIGFSVSMKPCVSRVSSRTAPYTRADLDFLNMVLIKPSGHREMLSRLGLTEEQSVYLSEYGHTGEQDAMFSIKEGIKQGRLRMATSWQWWRPALVMSGVLPSSIGGAV